MTGNPLDDVGEEEEKRVPRLSREEKRLAIDQVNDDAAFAEALLFSEGASRKDFEADAKASESRRAEKFRDHFERVSIISMWFGAVVFACLTIVWALNLIVPKKYQFLDDNQEDKLQLIITGGFVAGIASSHFKKRLNG